MKKKRKVTREENLKDHPSSKHCTKLYVPTLLFEKRRKKSQVYERFNRFQQADQSLASMRASFLGRKIMQKHFINFIVKLW